jgi:parvulin-like peptidyl-prolyl isomerase
MVLQHSTALSWEHMRYSLVLLTAAIAWGQTPVTQPVKPPAIPPPAQSVTPPPPPVSAETVVLTIGDQKITKAQFELILSTLTEQQRNQAQLQTPAGRRRLAESLAELKTMADEARVRKLDQTDKAKAEMAIQADRVLAQSLYEQLLQTVKPDEASLQTYYDAHKSEWEQVKAKHILIRFQGSRVPLKPNQKDLTVAEALAKAQEIRAKIVAGGDFAKLAETESDDSSNAAQGGELGYFGKGGMVAEFEKAAFSADPGKVTEPVKTVFGYHLILVEAHATKPFADVRNDIEAKVKPEAAQKAIAELKKKNAVVYDPDYFGK